MAICKSVPQTVGQGRLRLVRLWKERKVSVLVRDLAHQAQNNRALLVVRRSTKRKIEVKRLRIDPTYHRLSRCGSFVSRLQSKANHNRSTVSGNRLVGVDCRRHLHHSACGHHPVRHFAYGLQVRLPEDEDHIGKLRPFCAVAADSKSRCTMVKRVSAASAICYYFPTISCRTFVWASDSYIERPVQHTVGACNRSTHVGRFNTQT